MITLQDCIALSGVEPGEVDAVVEHESLPYMVALEKGAWMLEQSWGPPALRQIIRDDLDEAVSHGRLRHVDELMLTYRQACQRLPEGTERRRETRH